MIGPLAFMSPWLLLALAVLPAIWWLLRATPPRPKIVRFAPTWILEGLRAKQQTPERTPWWLMLIRMLAAAAVIFALAGPVLNPTTSDFTSKGPLAVVVDNGWDAAERWPERQAMLSRIISEAEADARPVLILQTASTSQAQSTRFTSPGEARDKARALMPQPFAPDRANVAEALSSLTAEADDLSIVWLASGLDFGAAGPVGEALSGLARGGDGLTVVSFSSGDAPLGLRMGTDAGARLVAEVITLPGQRRTGTVHAYSGKGQRLAAQPFTITAGASSAEVAFDLPLEMTNQVARLSVAGARAPAAVHLLDGRNKWHRIGLISGSSLGESQPLLAPIYYIERALSPFADIVKAGDSNMARSLDGLLEQNVSAMVLANIGQVVGRSLQRMREWVDRGGLLIRFAGPRLEQGGDNLLPVPLRFGGRTLGGALSWSEPQALAAPEETGPFAGLSVPEDARVERQVLADPARIPEDAQVWARLEDGTPLVTARPLGKGWTVLFHVTANTDWSSLPISGLFVEMLKRLLAFAPASGPADGVAAAQSPATETAADGNARPDRDAQRRLLAPTQTLDGFGVLTSPPVTARPISRADIAGRTPSATHPPGYYGSGSAAASLNLITADTVLAARPSPPAGARQMAYVSEQATSLGPYLFAFALALVLLDALAVMLIQSGGRYIRRGAAASLMMGGAFFGLAALAGPYNPAHAQDNSAASRLPEFALEAALETRFAYAVTGDAETDRASQLGLSGLSRILAARTAVEPGEPIGVDVTTDELAFFPLLYWPVQEGAEPLADATLAKIDAYMKQGGMILFDTRDYGQALPGLAGSNGSPALQSLLGELDVPRLEPVSDGHVLTKSFYLLDSFPGRWDGGTLWAEARRGGGNEPDRSDGVSSILITSNDFASAWALDESNRPVYPVVSGGEIQREMAFRTGVNIVMYALTGNYKADQVHVPALLERLGQ